VIARRLPIQSREPIVWLAVVRLVFAAAALASVVIFDVPHQERVAIAIGAIALPWSAAGLVLARGRPDLALSSLVAIVDFIVLGLIQVAEPEAYAGIRFVALFFVATHAYLLGEARGLLVAVVAIVTLVPAAALLNGTPVSGGMLAFYEALFSVSALASGLLVGRLRTAESAARLRARELSRRTIEAEARVRRRVAESIHDGPVQELVSLDLMLAAIDQAASRGDTELTRLRLADARELAERNVSALRDEIVGLGPYAFDEITFDTAVEQCAPVWHRRYGVEVELAIDQPDLSNEVCDALFGITQEAVANAGRHAGAERVVITLRPVDSEIELRISDDGRGFGASTPLATTEPGHIGLASMKERAELIGGSLEIETGERGTKVLVRAPIEGPGPGPAV